MKKGVGQQSAEGGQSKARHGPGPTFILPRFESHFFLSTLRINEAFHTTMSFYSIGRPVGCLKAVLRRTRQQRMIQRGIATAASDLPAAPRPVYSSRQRKESCSRLETMTAN